MALFLPPETDLNKINIGIGSGLKIGNLFCKKGNYMKSLITL